jgi:zinc protease
MPEPVREEKLANGLKLVLLRDSSLPRVHATLLALAGSAYDPADRQGVAVLTNSLLRAGAASWDRDQIALRFAGLGGVYGFSTSRDFSSARITAATPELAPALELLAALWLSPQFPPEDFERERKALVERAQRRLDNPSAAADAEAYGRLYGDHPYSRDPLGEPRTLQQITRDDVIQFQRNHYRPASSVLALVGDFDPEEVLRWARGLFGAEAATGAELAPLGPLPPPRYGEILRRRQWTDAYLMFCTPVPSLNDPEFAALLTLQRLLALRNFDRLIYQRSLVYQHSTSLSSYQLDSELCVEAQLPVSNASTASREIRHQIEALQKGQFDVADFEAARRWALGSLSLERMSAAGRARSLATLALYGLPAALYSELPERLRAVKLEDARSAAAEFLNPDRWVTIRLEP